MNTSLFPAPPDETKWGDGSRALLDGFLTDVANTPLRVKILALFLGDSGLCLPSEALARRLGEPIRDVQKAAQQLSNDGALHYCPQFAFADLCSLSLPFLSPAMRLQLDLLRFVLRHEPNWVWDRFEGDLASPQSALERHVMEGVRDTP